MIFDAIPTPIDILVLLLPQFVYIFVQYRLWQEARREDLFRWGFVSWLMRWGVDPKNFPMDKQYHANLMSFAVVCVVWWLVVFAGTETPDHFVDTLRQWHLR